MNEVENCYRSSGGNVFGFYGGFVQPEAGSRYGRFADLESGPLANPRCHPYADADTYTHPYSDAYIKSDADPHPNKNTDTNTNTDTNSNTD
jgi:hypothetical protein